MTQPLNTGSGDYFVWLLFYYCWSLIAVMVLGLPVFLICRWIGIVRWWLATGFGMFAGFLIVVAIVSGQLLRLPSNMSGLVTFMLSGGLGGLVFWSIWTFGQHLPFNSSKPGGNSPQ